MIFKILFLNPIIKSISKKNTALHIAVFQNSIDIVKLLLSKSDIDVNLKVIDGRILICFFLIIQLCILEF